MNLWSFENGSLWKFWPDHFCTGYHFKKLIFASGSFNRICKPNQIIKAPESWWRLKSPNECSQPHLNKSTFLFHSSLCHASHWVNLINLHFCVIIRKKIVIYMISCKTPRQARVSTVIYVHDNFETVYVTEFQFHRKTDAFFWCTSCMQIAFTTIVYPSLILAYMGQAAYLSRHHYIENDYRIGFYVSVPGMHPQLLLLKEVRSL